MSVSRALLRNLRGAPLYYSRFLAPLEEAAFLFRSTRWRYGSNEHWTIGTTCSMVNPHGPYGGETLQAACAQNLRVFYDNVPTLQPPNAGTDSYSLYNYSDVYFVVGIPRHNRHVHATWAPAHSGHPKPLPPPYWQQPIVYPRPATRPATRPRVAPRTRPAVRPARAFAPSPGLIPVGIPSPWGGRALSRDEGPQAPTGGRGNQPPRRLTRFRAPPGPATKEKKFRPTGIAAAILKGIGPITEGVDFIDAIHGALPYKKQAKGHGKNAKGVPNRPTPQAMLWALYENFDDISWPKAIGNVAQNQIEDAIIGRIGNRASKALYGLGSFSGTHGPAL